MCSTARCCDGASNRSPISPVSSGGWPLSNFARPICAMLNQPSDLAEQTPKEPFLPGQREQSTQKPSCHCNTFVLHYERSVHFCSCFAKFETELHVHTLHKSHSFVHTIRNSLPVTMPVNRGRLGKYDIRSQNKRTTYNACKFLEVIYVQSEHFGSINVYKTHEITAGA